MNNMGDAICDEVPKPSKPRPLPLPVPPPEDICKTDPEKCTVTRPPPPKICDLFPDLCTAPPVPLPLPYPGPLPPPVDCDKPPPIFTADMCAMKSDLFYNPFKADSAHHRPIGCGAMYADDNHPTTRNILQNTRAAISLSVGAPWGVVVMRTGTSDPITRINARPPACDRISNVPVSIRLPTGFNPRTASNHSGCPDGNNVFYDDTTGVPVLHHLRQYEWNNGNPRAGQYRNYDPRGLGHGVRAGDRQGTSASGVVPVFGILRGREINTPGMPIQHAMQLSLPRKPTNPCAMMLSKVAQLPAVGTDRSAKDPTNNLGAIAYGSLFALPTEERGGPSIDSLGLTEKGKRLAEAFRNYGAYAVDGTSCPHMRTDQDVQDVDEINRELKKIYPYLRIVLNSAWTSGQQSVGGGAPLAPNCGYDAP